MGHNPIPPRRKPTLLERVRDEYATGQRDLASLEQAVDEILRAEMGMLRTPPAPRIPVAPTYVTR